MPPLAPPPPRDARNHGPPPIACLLSDQPLTCLWSGFGELSSRATPTAPPLACSRLPCQPPFLPPSQRNPSLQPWLGFVQILPIRSGGPRRQVTMTTLGGERTAFSSLCSCWPCPSRGGGAGGAHPATTVAAVKVFFHLDIEIQGAVVQPPKVRKVDMLDGVTILRSEKAKDEIVLDGNDIELVSRSAALIN